MDNMLNDNCLNKFINTYRIKFFKSKRVRNKDRKNFYNYNEVSFQENRNNDGKAERLVKGAGKEVSKLRERREKV